MPSSKSSPRSPLGVTSMFALGWLVASAAVACGTQDETDAADAGACAACPSDCACAPPPSGSAASNDGGSAEPDGSAPVPDFTCPAGSTEAGPLPDGTVAGELSFPHPTLRNISILWPVEGDANDDALAEVHYRKQGSASWRTGMPLRRAKAGAAQNGAFSWAPRQAGSVFDLEPATAYEIEVRLADPDGGCLVRRGTVTTRPVPEPMAGAPVKTVTPGTFAAVAAAANPGDILELSAGSYAGFTFGRDGEAGKPIVIRAAGAPASVVIGGDVSLIGRKHVHLVGVTVNGRVRLSSTVGAVVTKTVVNTPSDGIDVGLRGEDAYIADNIVTGATDWAPTSLGVDGTNVGEGIRVNGPGHVVEHNLVRGFRDCLSTMDPGSSADQYSLDFVENDLDACADDGIEADACVHNCRVIRNRLTNVFMGMTSQPGLGGPTYFIRNAAYNVVYEPFKLHNDTSGDVLLHNTVVKNGDAFAVYTTDVVTNLITRNNVFIGGPGGTYGGYPNGSGKVMSLVSADATVSLDYDAFGSTAASFTGRLGATTFASLAELRAKTSAAHAVQVGLDVFAAAIGYPASPFPGRAAADLRLAPASAAVDTGSPIPNVNDGFSGSAPDMGCCEVGAPLPAYGPR